MPLTLLYGVLHQCSIKLAEYSWSGDSPLSPLAKLYLNHKMHGENLRLTPDRPETSTRLFFHQEIFRKASKAPYNYILKTRTFVQGSRTDPDPPDPYVFGPPGSGSGSTGQKYGSGSGSCSGSGSGSASSYHQAKIVRKNFDSRCFVTFFDFFIFEKLCKCTSKEK
jgi:hypothetical protein